MAIPTLQDGTNLWMYIVNLIIDWINTNPGIAETEDCVVWTGTLQPGVRQSVGKKMKSNARLTKVRVYAIIPPSGGNEVVRVQLTDVDSPTDYMDITILDGQNEGETTTGAFNFSTDDILLFTDVTFNGAGNYRFYLSYGVQV